MICQQFKQNVDSILRVGVLQYSEHDSIDGLNEIISSILDISRSQLLVDLTFMLIFVNQLSKGKFSSVSKKFSNVLHDMSALDATLEQRYLSHYPLGSVIFSH